MCAGTGNSDERGMIISCIQKRMSAELCAPGSLSWLAVSEAARYFPVAFTPGWKNYQNEYMHLTSERFESADVVLMNDSLPVAIWSLSVIDSRDGRSICTGEGPVRPPVFDRKQPHSVIKNVVRQCLDAVDLLRSELNLSQWRGIQSPRDQGLDYWHSALMERSAVCRLGHELYVDLSLDTDRIKSNFRKSYRPLVNKGMKLWDNEIHHGDIPEDVFAEFRELHYAVAGRVTRAIETWNLQKQAIRSREAFLVSLRDQSGRMVGAGLFHVSRDEGVYAVGAYDRNLFDLPLGHVVQMRAIEHMKSLGLRWYLLGYRHYPGDEYSPTDKELSISHFKEGFATHVFPQLLTVCQARTGTA